MVFNEESRDLLDLRGFVAQTVSRNSQRLVPFDSKRAGFLRRWCPWKLWPLAHPQGGSQFVVETHASLRSVDKNRRNPTHPAVVRSVLLLGGRPLLGETDGAAVNDEFGTVF